MTRQHTGQSMVQSAGQWTAVWLACAAAVLLSLAASFLSYTHSLQMQEMREQASQTRARLMAQSIGQRLAHATSTGIPLTQLVGVPEFLERWQKTHPEVTHIGVYGAQGQVLWHSRSPAGPTDSHVATGRADLLRDGAVHARVTLQLQSDPMDGLGKTAALLVPAVLLISALAYLAARFACAQGPWLRNHGLRMISRWAARGDYRRLLVLPQRRDFDLRVQEVTHAMRSVHERMARIRQLIGSLRRTEPQQLRRDYLDQILKGTEGKDLFTDTEPAIVRLVAAQSQSLWIALLLGLGAVGPLTYVLRAFQATANPADLWDAALPAASLAMLGLAAGIGWKLATHLRMATLSVLILGNAALLLPVLALLLDHALPPWGMAAWNGIFAGAAMAACTRAQTHPDPQQGFVHAQPLMPGAALLAWWGCLLWLAPALGYYAHAALPRPAAALALMLPIACALYFATRWDVAHSPWRVRMAPMPALSQPLRLRPLVALGTAAGLLAGLMLHAIATQASVHGPALLQQCALGAGLGMAWIFRSTRGPAAPPLAWPALAIGAIAAQLSTGQIGGLPALLPPAWLGTAQGLAYLLLGLLLGHGFAQAAQQPQAWVTLRLLLCGTLGAALCAGMVVLGLHAWASILAALLLVLPARAHPSIEGPHAPEVPHAD